MSNRVPMLISFSGLDGSGKSTHIEALRTALHSAGLTTRRLAFWDDVVVGVKYREGFVHKLYNSERGIGHPGRPVRRRDKNMRGWYLTVFRHFLYLLDAMNLRRVIAREQGLPARDAPDVLILDRYIYDELANLNLHNRLSRGFVRAVGALMPRPTVAYLLDADPAEARARKPEYPLEFMEQSRQSYYDLAALLGTMTLIPALGLPQARLRVLKAAERHLSEAGRPVHLAIDNVSAA